MKRHFLLLPALFAALLAGAAYPTSGTLGNHISWTLTDSVLTVSGTGKTPGFNTTNIDKLPWQDPEMAAAVRRIVVGEGITEIGSYFFGAREMIRDVRNAKDHGYYATQGGETTMLFCNVEEVVLPESLRKIGHHSFARMPLTAIRIPQGVSEIAAGAFANSSLKLICLPEGVTKLGPGVCESCRNLVGIDFNDARVKVPTGMAFDCERLRMLLHPGGIKAIEPSAFGATAFDAYHPDELLAMFRDSGPENFLRANMPDRSRFPGTDEDYEALRQQTLDRFYTSEATNATAMFRLDRMELGDYDPEHQNVVIHTVNFGDLLVSLTPEQARTIRETWPVVRKTAQPVFAPSNGRVLLQSVSLTVGPDVLPASPLTR